MQASRRMHPLPMKLRISSCSASGLLQKEEV